MKIGLKLKKIFKKFLRTKLIKKINGFYNFYRKYRL